jgi:hypothetical protein
MRGHLLMFGMLWPVRLVFAPDVFLGKTRLVRIRSTDRGVEGAPHDPLTR